MLIRTGTLHEKRLDAFVNKPFGEQSMPRVLNKYRDEIPEDAVNVMRPSKWGNPFPVQMFGRDVCVKLYEVYICENEGLRADLHELKGKDLVCCCKPKDCHADVLLRLANET